MHFFDDRQNDYKTQLIINYSMEGRVAQEWTDATLVTKRTATAIQIVIPSSLVYS